MSYNPGNSNRAIATASDVTLSNPADGQVLSYTAATGTWQNAKLPANYIINVTDYGATGDGITDDTASIIAARNAVIATKKTSPSTNNIPITLFFPGGVYLVTSTDALLFSPTTGTSQTLYGLHIMGAGKRSTRIIFSSAQTSSTDPRQGNLMTLANRVRGLRVSGINFMSTNANQSLCYMWCSSANDGTYAGYGSGAQNDIIWDDIGLSGAWTRGWGFDGDSAANQNSEQTWRTTYVSNDATFSDAIIRSGFSPFAAQQDQFCNYNFYDCQFEYKSGDFFVADMGGDINVYGGSFINGINSSTDGGTWFKMGNRSHAYDTKQLHVVGTRFEFRNLSCKLIDTYWAGSSSHISFDGITIANNYVASGSQAEHQTASFRVSGTAQGFVKFTNCQLPGYHLVDLTSDAVANQGRIVYELCNFRNYTGGATLSATGTFLRYATGMPKYRFLDCYGTTNTAN